MLYRELPSKIGHELKATIWFYGFQTKIRTADIRNTKTVTRLQRSVELIGCFSCFYTKTTFWGIWLAEGPNYTPMSLHTIILFFSFIQLFDYRCLLHKVTHYKNHISFDVCVPMFLIAKCLIFQTTIMSPFFFHLQLTVMFTFLSASAVILNSI